MSRYVCGICGYVYDESSGDPDNGTAPGTKWDELPDGWSCPMCTAPKAVFEKEGGEEQVEQKPASVEKKVTYADSGEMSFAEMSVLCSNLSKGCEKQYKTEESELFAQLAEYFKGKVPFPEGREFADISELIQNDLSSGYPAASSVSKEKADRGALRAVVWGEKVSKILRTVLMRYSKSGNGLLEETKIHVCEICGFVYIGEEPPEVCPVCKVPRFKIAQVARR